MKTQPIALTHLEVISKYLELRKIVFNIEEVGVALASINIYDVSLEQINTINQIIKN